MEVLSRLIFWVAALWVAAADARTRRIPLPALGLMLLGAAGTGGSAAGALICGGAMAAAWAASRGRLGEGDVVVAAALGLMLGAERGAATLMLGVGLAALPALVLTLRGRGKTPLPLAAFLVAAAAVTTAFG